MRRLRICVVAVLLSWGSASATEPCNFSWSAPVAKPRRIYDTFLYNGEQDMLMVRLKTLQPLVDFFVIAESHQTYQGRPKELFFENHTAHLDDDFKSKVIHIVHRTLGGGSTWKREQFQRSSLFSKGLRHPGKEAVAGDIIILSDVDEIPKPDLLSALKVSEGFPKVIALSCPITYYSYSFKGVDWGMLRVMLFDPELEADAIRHDVEPQCAMQNSCWHCSYCFETIAQVQNKLASFSHEEFNRPPYTDPGHILKSTREGVSLFNDQNGVTRGFEWTESPDAPAFVKASSELRYMLDRNATDARYSDAVLFGLP